MYETNIEKYINENGELIRVNAKHFDRDYAVSVYLYNEETEEYDIFDRDTFYTSTEMCRLAKAKLITWYDDAKEV